MAKEDGEGGSRRSREGGLLVASGWLAARPLAARRSLALGLSRYDHGPSRAQPAYNLTQRHRVSEAQRTIKHPLRVSVLIPCQSYPRLHSRATRGRRATNFLFLGVAILFFTRIGSRLTAFAEAFPREAR